MDFAAVGIETRLSPNAESFFTAVIMHFQTSLAYLAQLCGDIPNPPFEYHRSSKIGTSFHGVQGKVAKWWIPEDCVFVEEIPHTAAGKISKLQLRQKFKKYESPKSKL